MELASGILKKYKKNFLLDEDGVRRLEGVLAKAAAAYPESLLLLYHVEREDDRFFETESLAEVLSDPNINTHRINVLGISLEQATSEPRAGRDRERVAWVVFDNSEPSFSKSNVHVRISSPHKTWALMLADEIEPQITRLFKIKEVSIWVFFACAIVAGLIGYRLGVIGGLDPLSSAKKGAIYSALTLAFVLAAKSSIALYGKPVWFKKYFMSESVFLWGEETHHYVERERLRRNIFWVVLVGFLVSLAAGVAALAF